MEDQKLDAVISLPSGVFKPYAGVSTAILFFTKTNSGGTDQVWFYDMKADGFSLDDKRTPQEKSDLPDILARWKSVGSVYDRRTNSPGQKATVIDRRYNETMRKRTDPSSLVPKSEIAAQGYDLSEPLQGSRTRSHSPRLAQKNLRQSHQAGSRDPEGHEGAGGAVEMRFPEVSLGNLTNIRTGKLDANASSEDGEYPFFTCAQKPLRISSYSYDCECVLIAGNGDLNVKYYQGKFDAYQRTYIVESLLEKRSKLSLRYTYHFLETYLETLREQSIGGIIKYIKMGNLTEAQIPLPPLAEQKRIAGILDAADALRAKRRADLAQLDSLTQSLFLDLFGDPVENERGWPVTIISDFVAGFESGKSLVAGDEDASESPFRVLKISAVTPLEFRPEQSKALPPDYVPPASHFVRDGDLLFSRANTSELIGATAYVRQAPANLLLPDKLWRFVWHESPKADPRFVRFLFQRPKFRAEIASRATGTSGSMKNISQGKVLTISCGLPPLPLQRRFAAMVESIERQKTRHRAHLAELDALFASLQHRAFRGEL